MLGLVKSKTTVGHGTGYWSIGFGLEMLNGTHGMEVTRGIAYGLTLIMGLLLAKKKLLLVIVTESPTQTSFLSTGSSPRPPVSAVHHHSQNQI
ncbi:hypothetical protein L2E82_32106 [Cichorium intybus]|uniref:Uncharacterized protein n=1 Tax=Cichorium intybus TaxID=13427 RepID=A0ACB9BF28_CICIN|nr:hypothetical protein L2E82_32106 [Cichorium intybus]